MSAEEVRAVLRIFREEKGVILNLAGGEIFQHEPDYLLMIGVSANLETIYGHTQKRPNRYPGLDAIPGIFSSCQGDILKLIHYNTKIDKLLFVQLMALTERIGSKNFDGFQLNITWPPPLEILVFKSAYPHLKIVLRVGSDAFRDIGDLSDYLSQKLMMYVGLFDYVLLNFSGGKGLALEPEKLQPYLRAITKEFGDRIGIVVAGGLSGSTMHLLESIPEECQNISIDAQKKLRNENDHLDLNFVDDYIFKAFAIFRFFSGLYDRDKRERVG